MATIHFTLDSKDILYMLKHDSSGACRITIHVLHIENIKSEIPL